MDFLLSFLYNKYSGISFARKNKDEEPIPLKMKKILSLILIVLMLIPLGACSSEEEVTAVPDVEVDEQYLDYQSETDAMTYEDAESYLASEDADPTTPEYRRAVLTVNTATAQSIIKKVQDTKEVTEEIEALFEGVAFRFIEGDTFASSSVKSLLSKQGTYALGTDGYYYFTFFDRTLPQTATNLNGDNHTLAAYAEVLDILLSDPNVEVRVVTQ